MQRLAFALAMLPALSGAQIAENSLLRIEVSPDTGSIVRLYDKRSRTDYVSDRAKARLFELLIPDATNYSRRIVSWTNRPASVRTTNGGIEIRYPQLRPDEEQYRFGSGVMHFAEPLLDIEALVTLRLEGDHIEAHMRLNNHSLITITGVAFPYIGGLVPSLGSEAARIVLPSMSQRIYHTTTGALSGQKALRYPGMLTTSWLNYEFPSRGFGLEVRSGLQAQDAYFSLSPGPFREGSAYRGRDDYPFISWIHYPHLPGRGQWTAPPAILHVHETDWHGIAAEHREWYRATARPRASKAFREHLGLATYLLKSHDNTIRWKYEDLPALADKSGMRRIVIDGWRQREGPANPAPFGEITDPRLGDTEELRRTIAALHAKGTELLFTFHPTILNVTGGELPAQIGMWAVKTRRQANQLPVDFLYHTFDYPDSVEQASYRVELDPASPAGAALAAQARRLKEEYGFRNLLLKGLGQQAFLSYNRHHGVAPQDVYATGYPRLLGELRKTYGEGLLLAEGLNDLVGPLVDAAYTWDQSRDTAVLAYSLPWSTFSNDVEALDYAAVNAAFAYGMLANLIVDGGQGTVADYPPFARHLRQLHELKRATAPYYADAEFRDHDGLRDIQSDPGIVIAAYVSATEPRHGVVIANLAAEPKNARFRIDGPVEPDTVRVFPQDAAQISVTDAIALLLEGHEVRFIAWTADRKP